MNYKKTKEQTKTHEINTQRNKETPTEQTKDINKETIQNTWDKQTHNNKRITT